MSYLRQKSRILRTYPESDHPAIILDGCLVSLPPLISAYSREISENMQTCYYSIALASLCLNTNPQALTGMREGGQDFIWVEGCKWLTHRELSDSCAYIDHSMSFSDVGTTWNCLSFRDTGSGICVDMNYHSQVFIWSYYRRFHRHPLILQISPFQRVSQY